MSVELTRTPPSAISVTICYRYDVKVASVGYWSAVPRSDTTLAIASRLHPEMPSKSGTYTKAICVESSNITDSGNETPSSDI
ncbi:hypothetical protein Tco_1064377 [Tanacetum coccineum]